MIASQYATLTIAGVRLQFQGIAPFTAEYDAPNTTLNSQYSVFNQTPATTPKVRCFGIGINGFYMNSTNLAQPYMPKATNVHLHIPIPFRVVPVDEDLDPITEMPLYRMRQRITHGGEDYFAYWLKVLTYPTGAITVQRIAPDGTPTTYTPLPDELLSTPSPANVIATDDEADIINTSFVGHIDVSYAEVMEAINVLYDGNILQAKISEVGLFSGSDELVSGLTGGGAALSYTELIYAQLFYHRCSIGTDLSEVGSRLESNLSIRDGNLVLRS
jgi:hypothetical protein